MIGKKISNSHNQFNIFYSGRTAKATRAAGGTGPQFGPLEENGRVSCKECLPDQLSHIEGRSEFDRASSCARPALDAYIELVILNKSFRIDFHFDGTPHPIPLPQEERGLLEQSTNPGPPP